MFEANPGFSPSLGGRPYLDRYIWRVIPEQTTLLADLLTGSVDLYIQPSPDQAQQIIDHPDVDLQRFIGRSYVYVGWNARRPQLADPRVRRAITLGTDRETIVEAIQQGYGTVANAALPPVASACSMWPRIRSAAAALTTGPRFVVPSSGFPTTYSRVLAT